MSTQTYYTAISRQPEHEYDVTHTRTQTLGQSSVCVLTQDSHLSTSNHQNCPLMKDYKNLFNKPKIRNQRQYCWNVSAVQKSNRPASPWNNGCTLHKTTPDSKVHRVNMGPTWVLSVPDGPHVSPMNLAIWDCSIECFTTALTFHDFAATKEDSSLPSPILSEPLPTVNHVHPFPLMAGYIENVLTFCTP